MMSTLGFYHIVVTVTAYCLGILIATGLMSIAGRLYIEWRYRRRRGRSR